MDKRVFEERCKGAGVFVDTWSPGDGVTRYRFFSVPSDYFAGDALFTALGRKEAETFLRGYEAAAYRRARRENEVA